MTPNICISVYQPVCYTHLAFNNIINLYPLGRTLVYAPTADIADDKSLYRPWFGSEVNRRDNGSDLS